MSDNNFHEVDYTVIDGKRVVCPFDNTKRVLAGSKLCSACSFHKGNDLDSKLIKCSCFSAKEFSEVPLDLPKSSKQKSLKDLLSEDDLDLDLNGLDVEDLLDELAELINSNAMMKLFVLESLEAFIVDKTLGILSRIGDKLNLSEEEAQTILRHAIDKLITYC